MVFLTPRGEIPLPLPYGMSLSPPIIPASATLAVQILLSLWAIEVKLRQNFAQLFGLLPPISEKVKQFRSAGSNCANETPHSHKIVAGVSHPFE